MIKGLKLYSFKIAEPIRFALKVKSSGFSDVDANDFVSKYSPILNPKDEVDISGAFLDDKPFYWTPIFYLFKSGKYAIHIINENEDVDVKIMFEIKEEFHDIDNSKILI